MEPISIDYEITLVGGQGVILIPGLNIAIANYFSFDVLTPGGIPGVLSIGAVIPGIGVLVVSTSVLDSSLIKVTHTYTPPSP